MATLLRKAQETDGFQDMDFSSDDEIWKLLMLEPKDYSQKAILNSKTKALMDKITFEHGGEEFDEKYPLGIPTQLEITTSAGEVFDSGLVMFPPGHSK